MTEKRRFATVDEYLAAHDGLVRAQLDEMRAIIRAAAPDAEEKISYQIPTFAQNGIIVSFAAWKEHIGLYPAPSGVDAFRDAIAPYFESKGTLRFRLDEPLPAELIQRIVRYRLDENNDKAKAKAAKMRKMK